MLFQPFWLVVQLSLKLERFNLIQKLLKLISVSYIHTYETFIILCLCFFSMHAESIWKCDPYLPTPVVHASLDQASKTYSSSQYPSAVSWTLSTFKMICPCVRVFQGKSSITLLFLPFYRDSPRRKIC